MRVQIKARHPETENNSQYPRRSNKRRGKLIAGLTKHCKNHTNDTASWARLARIEKGADR